MKPALVLLFVRSTAAIARRPGVIADAVCTLHVRARAVHVPGPVGALAHMAGPDKAAAHVPGPVAYGVLPLCKPPTR